MLYLQLLIEVFVVFVSSTMEFEHAPPIQYKNVKKKKNKTTDKLTLIHTQRPTYITRPLAEARASLCIKICLSGVIFDQEHLYFLQLGDS